MEIKYLDTFMVVAKELSFTKAAKTLGLTQAAISRQIKYLENSLGKQVLIRSPQKVMLTPDGSSLFERAMPLFQFLNQEFSDQNFGPLKIGSLQGFGENWLLKRLIKYSKKNDFPFEVTVGGENGLIEKLNRSELDLIFTTQNIQSGYLSSRKIIPEEIVIVSKESINPKKLGDYNWVTYNQDDFLFELSRAKGQHIYKMNSITSMIKMVESGVGIAALPEFFVHENSKVLKTKLRKKVGGYIYLTMPNFDVIPGHIKKLLSFL
ncbi:MAG: LysR family transcriptional regulator [Bacteriovoracaceae bacterium]|nr:LysR family transcriptional regulator [Bacteriovoracaceae bacterium]